MLVCVRVCVYDNRLLNKRPQQTPAERVHTFCEENSFARKGKNNGIFLFYYF